MVVQSISHLANDLLQHITTGQNPFKIINLRIICVTLSLIFTFVFFLLIMVTDTVYIVLVAVYYFAVSP